MSDSEEKKVIEQPPVIDDDEDAKFTDLSQLSETQLAEAMRQLTSRDKPNLIDEEETAATTTTTATTEETKKEKEEEVIEVVTPKPWENKEALALNASKKNARSLVCPFCLKSCIILANTGVHVEKEIFMIHPNAKSKDDGVTHKDFFKITSKMDFENIEVKRHSEGDKFRYLTCADCGSGPLGVTYDADNNRVFYVSHNRTRYGRK